jgi:hypothetical protein
LGQLWDCDQVGEISQVGALIVKLDKAIVLRVVSLAKGLQRIVVASSGMHCTKHARDELVNAVAFLNERDKSSNPAFVVANVSEMGEDELLELVNLVLQNHQVANGLVAFVGIVYGLETNVFFVLERAVEFGVLLMERELGQEVVDIFANQRSIATHALAGHATVQTIDPTSIGHGLSQGSRVAFLQHFVDGDESFESLDLVGKNRLPEIRGRVRSCLV